MQMPQMSDICISVNQLFSWWIMMVKMLFQKVKLCYDSEKDSPRKAFSTKQYHTCWYTAISMSCYDTEVMPSIANIYVQKSQLSKSMFTRVNKQTPPPIQIS